ncbi:MAG: MG2 domain-containing protein, partial [Ignavibacterium sp.]|nr:MG2 domain-containing protein [Ignavibacterium sp.]MDW8374311.1 MG2 domain-containing protein [Ignavibacteriales bacterium]
MNIKFNSATYSFLILLFSSLIFIGASSNMPSKENNFYLSNYSIFKPGDEVKVNIYHYENRRLDLELALLKVSDPVKLFNNLSSNKRRYNFDIWGENNQFLLENTERIKSWKDFIDRNNFYQNYLNLGKIENPGLYILQVKNQSQIAYCPILVTNYSIISKEFNSSLLATVVDIQTGEIIRNSEIIVFAKDSAQKRLRPDKDGIFLEKTNASNNDIQLFAKVKDEIIPFNVYSFFGQENNWNLVGYVYTNQPVYRPSQVVNFKAILRLTKGNETKNFENQTCKVKITSPQNKTVFSEELTTNDFGTINGSFILDDEADLGNYTIEISQDNYRVYGNFSVEEYKKPEFKVLVNTEFNHYSIGDTINGSVSAEYYFGAKVKNATVKVNIFKQQYWFPWWRGHRFAWFYDSFEKIRPYPGFGNELVQQIEGELDENGKFNFSIKPLSEKEYDFRYNIVAEVTDQSRIAISGSKEVLVSRGLFSISSSTEKYFYKPNEEVKIKVNITDFDNKGVQTDFKVIIIYPEDKLYRPSHLKDTIISKTNQNGIGLALFKPRGNVSGYFSYQVIAIDKKENEISSGGSFYVGDYQNYFQTRFSNQIEIVTDKDVYEIGDTLTAIIFTPIQSQQFLLTLETDEVLNYKILTSKNH